MNTFRLQLNAWIEKTRADADKVLRNALLDLDRRLVSRSPVGDPDKWATPMTQSRKTGKMHFNRPRGYVGGRFKNNWQMSVGSPATGTIDVSDPTGAATLAANASITSTAKMGQIYYLTNNLPYARRIEDGWSKQAPVGVVALAVVEWNTIVDNAVNGVRQGTGAADFAQAWETYGL